MSYHNSAKAEGVKHCIVALANFQNSVSMLAPASIDKSACSPAGIISPELGPAELLRNCLLALWNFARVRWQLYWCLWCECRVRCWWESVLTVEVFTRPDPAPDWGHCHRCTSRGSRGDGTGYSSDALTHFYNILTPHTNAEIQQPGASFRAVNISILPVAGFSFNDIYKLSTCSSCSHECYWDFDFHHHALISFYHPCYGSKCALNILFWWCGRYILL